MIFNLYLRGKSVLGILKELEQQGIKSPTGKDKWCKRTIDVMLSNEKYTGTVRLLDSDKHEVQFYEHLYPETKMICGDITDSAVFERVKEEALQASVNF